MDECSFEQTIELPGGGYQTSKCMNKAEILFVKDPCCGLCFACAYRKVLAENKLLEAMPGTAICAYCGAKFGALAGDSKEDIVGLAASHILTCQKNPLVVENKRLQKENDVGVKVRRGLIAEKTKWQKRYMNIVNKP